MSVKTPLNVGNVAGSGRIGLTLHGRQAVFTELSYRYPLKLLSPRVTEPTVAIAYVLTYGGGLVSGDRTHLHVDVGLGASLLLLTQGSTKVFKHRPGARLAKAAEEISDTFGASTVQRLEVHVQTDGLLLLLPDPITCFSAASYNQVQTFHLEDGASVVVLDWITSGRMSRGEEWQFSRYYSVNEIWACKKRAARDVLLLEGCEDNARPLKERMGIYSCYATLFLCGPKLRTVVGALSADYHEICVYQQSSPSDLLWSMSCIEQGCVVRVAGMTTESVRQWIRTSLNRLEEHVGADVLGKAFL
ncbi:UreD-domain-containing protein [Fomitiporia mediterranea MF3/22]|uniref:UreD-domain-containing protein n=1 Tax=Fomitiporia mediterranea (strain MF3/22) TaxID=694068 RepID=UPI0004407A64|nr:UreD-domain-containing protein [Fomitiporia mediterranea MF3/22]EJD04058.1 UreD-domain-containing protein [Fomitiporia mediterranea MF3/22]